VVTADIGSHIDAFLELVANDDNESAVDVVEIDSVVLIGLVYDGPQLELSLLNRWPTKPHTRTPNYYMLSTPRRTRSRKH